MQQPGLSLSADPDPVTLASEESQTVQIAVASLRGGQDDGLLLVKSSPMGLQVGLDKTTVGPGDNVTLIMTDTQGLAPGDHALVLQAVGPYHIATYTLTVQAVKGGYGILAQPTAQVAVREQVVAYELTLARYDGEDSPVTLTLPESAAPPLTQVGFSPNPDSTLPPDLPVTATLDPGETVYLLVQPSALAPVGAHSLLITTSSAVGDPTPVTLALTIVEAGTRIIYLPLVQQR